MCTRLSARSRVIHFSRRIVVSAIFFAGPALQMFAQTDAPATGKNQQIEQRLDALMDALNATRQELTESQAEIHALQRELQAIKQHGATPDVDVLTSGQPATQLADAVAHLQENQDVMQSEVAQHEQSKVETRSKYPVKITGLLLFNSFVNRGAVDHIDAPVLALQRTPDRANGSTGATMRQTILGFDAVGPSIFGAGSHGDLRVDFFGGILSSGYAASEGILRLRTAHAALDWPDTHLIAMLDRPIFSPLTPTSLAVAGIAPLAWSGNLWTWLPQIALSQQIHLGEQQFGIEAGVIDVSDPPWAYKMPAKPVSAAQRSLYPGTELRLSYSGTGSRGVALGVGGYWSPHLYDYGQHTNAWAVTADWLLPLPARMELSGEFYRGLALAGLGGGVYKDTVLFKPDAEQYSQLQGLNALGGWGQLKFRMTDKLEWNVAAGQDNGYASQLKQAQLDYNNPYASLARNQTVFGNFIYKPSNYLLFSLEYREMRSWPIYGSSNTAQSYVLSTAYEF